MHRRASKPRRRRVPLLLALPALVALGVAAGPPRRDHGGTPSGSSRAEVTVEAGDVSADVTAQTDLKRTETSGHVTAEFLYDQLPLPPITVSIPPEDRPPSQGRHSSGGPADPGEREVYGHQDEPGLCWDAFGVFNS